MMRDMEYVGNWSELPTDLFGPIASRLNLLEDFMAMKGVCTSWRAAAAANTNKFVCKVPLLMLPEKDGSDEREFYSLAKLKVCARIPIPEAKGKRCFDVGFGWLLALSCEDEGEACLLNPFSSARFQLPDYSTVKRPKSIDIFPPFHSIERGWLTANPSETSNFILVVNLNMRTGFWRNGDLKWTSIKSGGPVVTYFKGKICILDMRGHVLIWDPQHLRSKPKGLVVKVDNAPTSMSNLWHDYLVGSTAGDLLIVRRIFKYTVEFIATNVSHFSVMRVDPVERKCIQVDDLGKDAIFLGENAAVSVDATEFPGVLKPNCIYFTDDRGTSFFQPELCPDGGGNDMGIYSVADRSIQKFDVKSLSIICPPFWMFPSI